MEGDQENCTKTKSQNDDDVLTGLLNDLSISNKIDDKECPVVLYYGFFFNEQICASLKAISEKYLKDCYEMVPEFEKFLRDSYAKANGSTDPLNFYKYPSKKKKRPVLPDYHVTSKFCDRDKEVCSEYWDKVNNMIGKSFLIRIIGIVFTEKTFSFRVKLSKDQQRIFDERRAPSALNDNPKRNQVVVQLETNDLESVSESRSSSKQFKKNKNSENKTIPSDYDGITLSAQLTEEEIFTQCKSRAHVTIGCAKFVNAVQAGEDLIDIVDLETRLSSIFHKDYQLQCGGTLRQFGLFKDAFVIYLSRHLIVEAEFKFKE